MPNRKAVEKINSITGWRDLYLIRVSCDEPLFLFLHIFMSGLLIKKCYWLHLPFTSDHERLQRLISLVSVREHIKLAPLHSFFSVQICL